MTRSLGIRSALLLAIALTVASTVVAASALYGYQLYRTRQAIEKVRILVLAEGYAAQIATQLTTSEGGGAALRRLDWHPELCLAAVLRDNAEPLVLHGGRSLLDSFEPGHRPELNLPAFYTSPQQAGPPLPELHYAAVAIRPTGGKQSLGTLVCAIRSLQRGIDSREVAGFLTRLGVLGLAGIAIGLWWLKRQVLEPLHKLAARSETAAELTCAAPPLPVDRNDEIGQVARVLTEMHDEVDEWRHRAERLERSVDSRVAEETQKVARELKRAETQIYTDALTQLGNRRLLEEKFASVFRAQQQADQDLAVVMLDVDNFKTLNDSLGHRAGDDLLRFIGELLRNSLRSQDLAIRYGGDEFILILPAVTAKDAASVAERTIRLFAQQARLLAVEPKPSMSAGIASLWQHEPETPEGLLGIADEALYTSKRSGKACVHVYGAREAVIH